MTLNGRVRFPLVHDCKTTPEQMEGSVRDGKAGQVVIIKNCESAMRFDSALPTHLQMGRNYHTQIGRREICGSGATRSLLNENSK